jgi:AcrR family transcriptional regulator
MSRALLLFSFERSVIGLAFRFVFSAMVRLQCSRIMPCRGRLCRMATGLRARVRAEMMSEIKVVARQHLATDGANLSLRAVARDLGMVSSAIYRYYPSRDDLLTALIIDAYNAVGECVENAAEAARGAEAAKRFVAIATAVRQWASQTPTEYALIYGSPVPGYAAPQDTVGPAARAVFVLAEILRDGYEDGTFVSPTRPRLPAPVRSDMRTVGEIAGFEGIPEALLAVGIGAWAHVLGLLSAELFGQLVGSVTDYDAFFDYQVRSIATSLEGPPA